MINMGNGLVAVLLRMLFGIYYFPDQKNALETHNVNGLWRSSSLTNIFTTRIYRTILKQYSRNNYLIFQRCPKSSVGSLINNDGDGYENVTQKVKSRYFKLYRAYSIWLNSSNIDKFLWS